MPGVFSKPKMVQFYKGLRGATAYLPKVVSAANTIQKMVRNKLFKRKTTRKPTLKNHYNAINQKLRGASGLVTESSFAITIPMNEQVKTMKLVVPNKVRLTQYASPTLTCDPGFQNYFNFSLLDYNFLNALNATLPPSSVGGAIGQSTGPNRLVVSNVQSEYVITNVTNATLEVEIYDCTVKKDVPSGLILGTGGKNYNVTGGNPVEFLLQGVLASEGANTGVTPSPALFVGSVPQDSVFFKDYFKIEKQTSITMPLGSAHRHKINLGVNKLINEEIMNNNLTLAIKGLTYFTMIRIKGLPVIDASGAGDLSTTSSGAIACVQSQRVKYCFVSDARATGTYIDNLTSPALGNQGMINAVSGQIEQVQRV